jgi:hypothetical protein
MDDQANHPVAVPHDSIQTSFLRADQIQETDRTSRARSRDSTVNGDLQPPHYFKDPRPAPKPPRPDSFCDVADRAIRQHTSNAAYGQSVRPAESMLAGNGDANTKLDHHMLRRSNSYKLRKAIDSKLTHAQHEEDICKLKARVAQAARKILRAYGDSVKLPRATDDTAVAPYAGT